MKWIRFGVWILTGVGSIEVTLHAIYATWAIDLRADPLVTYLYCLFPGLTCFVFLLVWPLRIKAALLWLLAVGYLLTASILNWRTCAELGYCGTVASTVILTLKTKPVLAAFAVALLSLVPLLLPNGQRQPDARRTESVVE